MKRFYTYIIAAFSFALMNSCIENDLSYPALNPEFTSFEVEGQKSVEIDPAQCRINIVLGETADISRVKVASYSVAHEAEVVGGMPEFLDLTDTVSLVLRVYKDVEWKISAVQPIDRHIRCDNQVGDADIDHVKKIAFVYVTENQPLTSIKINQMKLEPEGSKILSTTGFVSVNGQSVPKTEECDFPMVLDCVIMRYFMVEYQGQQIQWAVKFLQKAVSVGIDAVNAWTVSANVKGVTNGQGIAQMEYRKAADQQWTPVEGLSVSGTKVSAHLTGLDENTDYVVRLTNGIDTSDEVAFKTGVAEQLPNLSFDAWSNGGKYPNAEGSNIWDSANSSGVTITTSPSDDSVKGKAARLESLKKFGVMAAGNIFTGSFGNFVISGGAGASLNWGTPFSERPLALRGYYKYSPQIITDVRSPYENLKGQTDQSQILMFLTDWTAPFVVNTATATFVDLENDKGIIALGQLNTSEVDSDYVQFTLPLVYRDNARIPTYLVIAAASSRFGDYFTGGIGSVLYIDEFEFIYDPEELTDEEYKQVFSKVDPV